MKRASWLLVVGLTTLCVRQPARAEIVATIEVGRQAGAGEQNPLTGVDQLLSEDGVRFARKLLKSGNGAGGYYSGPSLDFTKMACGSLNLATPGTVLRVTARYFQGAGNTNPYHDAPVVARLHDVQGRVADLGIVYGSRPAATYPAWLTCVADVKSPASGDFDFAHVARLEFSGTDWAGKGGDYVDFREVAFIAPENADSCNTFFEAARLDDGSPVKLIGAARSGGPDATFTIEDYWYSIEFSVREPANCAQLSAAFEGRMVMVSGTIETDPASRVRYIRPQWWTYSGMQPAAELLQPKAKVSATCKDLVVNAHEFRDRYFTHAIELTGQVVGAEPASCRVFLEDAASEGSAQHVAVTTAAIPSWQRPAFHPGDQVTVTGVCCAYLDASGKWQAELRVRDRNDIKHHFAPGNEAKTIRVFVLSCDPKCPQYGNRRTHEVFGWSDPRELARQYLQALAESSNGWVRYEIAVWHDADYYPDNTDGFRYHPDEYVRAFKDRAATPLNAGRADVVHAFADKRYPHNQPNSIVERVAAGEIDEVFFFSPPGAFNTWEGMMAGPSPFFVNGDTYRIPEAKRNFVAHGFNYERGVDCMLEDFCHRAECTMSHVYRAKNLWLPTAPAEHLWDAFRMYEKQGPGLAACGICHFAPNSAGDYDWANSTPVVSMCDDWLYHWPSLQGSSCRRTVTNAEWGGGAMDKHHIWWLNHIPKAAGINPDGKQNNWWKYLCDFNAYVK